MVSIELPLDYPWDIVPDASLDTAGFETDIRNDPFDQAQSLYKVRDGAELTVLDHKDNWLQVADSAQRTGWVRRDQVLIFNLAAPSWTKS